MSACKLRGQSRISRPAQVSLLLAAWPAGSFGPAVARASRSGDGRAEVPAGAEVPADRRAGGRRQDHGHLRPRVEVQQAGAALADALRIKEGDVVVSRHQQRFIDGTAFSLQTSFYPMSLVEHGATRLIEAADLSEGTVAYLANTLGIKQVGYRDSIQVRPPDESPFSRSTVFRSTRPGSGSGSRSPCTRWTGTACASTLALSRAARATPPSVSSWRAACPAHASRLR